MKKPYSGVYLSQLMGIDDYAQSPVISNKLFKKFGGQWITLMGLIFSLGGDVAVGNSQFSAYEEDWYVGTFHNKYAIADPGPGNSITMAMSPQDIDSAGRIYPSDQYTINFPNGTQGYIDQAVDFSNPAEPTIHIRPVSLSKSIGAIPAGYEFSTHSIASGSGEYAAQGKTNSYTKRDFYAQIFHLQVQMDGEFIATQSWLDSIQESKRKDGSFAYWSEALMKTEYMLKLAMNEQYWDGDELDDPSTAPLVPTGNPGAGNRKYFTKGLIKHAKDGGYNYTYTPGNLSLQDFYNWDTYLASQGGANSADMLHIHGLDLSHEIDQLFFTQLKNTNVDYTKRQASMFMGEDNLDNRNEIAVDMGIKSIKAGSTVFHNYSYGLWSHPKLYPTASGYNYAKRGLIMPVGKMVDAKTNVEMPIISNCYRANGGLNRKYRFNVFNGPGAETEGGTLIYETDISKAILFAHSGLRAMCVNNLISVDV